MTPPTVSAVINYFDAERFLREAIESVLAQTFTDWELILVDDGSADAGPDIARAYAAAHPGRVVPIEHPGRVNRGTSASRNLGAARARGRWIAFLDSDDAWSPSHLAARLALIERFPGAELAYGPGLLWHSWDGRSEDAMQPIGFDAPTMPAPADLASLYLRDGNVTPCPSGLLVRTDTYARLGGFEAAFRGMYDDQVFCFKAALDARVVVTPERTFRYRQHADSCCAVSFRTGTHAQARMHFLSWTRDYLRSHHPDLKQVMRVNNLQRFDMARSHGVPGAVMRAFRKVSPVSFRRWLSSFR